MTLFRLDPTSGAADVATPRLRLPLALTSGGGLAALVQGEPAEISQSVALLVDTVPGDRRVVPDYGYPNPLGGLSVDPTQVAAVIREWEPRADPATVDVAIDAPASGGVYDMTVVPNDQQTITTTEDGVTG